MGFCKSIVTADCPIISISLLEETSIVLVVRRMLSSEYQFMIFHHDPFWNHCRHHWFHRQQIFIDWRMQHPQSPDMYKKHFHTMDHFPPSVIFQPLIFYIQILRKIISFHSHGKKTIP